MFQGSLEVFKNEIYPRHGINGIGYNIDLSAGEGVSEGRKPMGIILERRYISNTGGFKVMDHGFLTLDLPSGRLKLDLDESPTSNVHLD
jgi:hypothetical protein